MQTVGYCRVSTIEQAISGHSLDAQEAAIRKWADGQGYTIKAIFKDEGLSGSKMNNRANLQDALTMARRCKGVFVVYSLSRASRSIVDSISIMDGLRKAGAHFKSLTEEFDTTTAAGQAFFHMVMVFAEFERNLTRERTRAIQANLRREGRRISGYVPYGYQLARDGRTLLPIPEEEEAIVMMATLRAQGETLQAICDVLTERGYQPKRGSKWHRNTVRAIIERYEKLTPIGCRTE